MTRRILLSSALLLLFVVLAGGSDDAAGTLAGAQLNQETTDYLNNNGILQPGENVIVYYDVTISGNDEQSCIVTNQRVVFHNSPKTTGIALADITAIEAKDEALSGKVITVRGGAGELLKLEIAPLNGGDFFLAELQNAAAAAGATF